MDKSRTPQDKPARVDPKRAAEMLFAPKPSRLQPGKLVAADARPAPGDLRTIRDAAKRKTPSMIDAVRVERSRASVTLDRLGASLARLTRSEAGTRGTVQDVAGRLAALEEMVARLATAEPQARPWSPPRRHPRRSR